MYTYIWWYIILFAVHYVNTWKHMGNMMLETFGTIEI